ncbi:MAG: DUF3784 domain-containing protein [Lewinella sp.]|nr:DUF3784 domain-containing protein [Lewinella sp.]
MTTFAILYGLFFVLLGFLVKAFPNLIAGYNTMPPEKKENVDIEGLSTFMRDSFIVLGAIIMLAYFALRALGWDQMAEAVFWFVPTVGVVLMVIRAQRYDQN